MTNVEHEYDPFKTDSGFKDDFDGTIVDSWFATDPKYNNGQTTLWFWKGLADDGEEVENRYGTGSDWGSYDGGVTVEHPKDTPDRPKAFQNGTAYAEFFAEAMAVGAEDELRRRSREELGNRGPRDARLWIGLRFHFEVKTETRKIKDRETQEIKDITTNRTLPTSFLGVDGGLLAGATAGAQGSPAAAPGMTPAPVVPGTPGVAQPATPLSVPNPGIAAPEAAVPGTPAAPAPIPQPGPIAAPAPVAQPAPVAAAPAPAPAPVAADDPWAWWAQLDPALQVAVKGHAAASDYPTFVDAVLSLPGAVDNAMLMQALGDENLYNALRTS